MTPTASDGGSRRRPGDRAVAVAPDEMYAAAYARQIDDQDVSIVDCTSFVVAGRLRVREVFGFDRHFATMGFLLRP